MTRAVGWIVVEELIGAEAVRRVGVVRIAVRDSERWTLDLNGRGIREPGSEFGKLH